MFVKNIILLIMFASLMKEECGVDGIGHDIGDHIQINDIDVELTPADHAWQKSNC